MSDVELIRYRIEPGKTGRFGEWMESLAEREDEALATIEDEGVYTEAGFLERGEDADYAVFFVEAADLDRAHEAFAESTHEVDEEFRELLEEVVAGEPARGIEPLYHLVHPERPSGSELASASGRGGGSAAGSGSDPGPGPESNAGSGPDSGPGPDLGRD